MMRRNMILSAQELDLLAWLMKQPPPVHINTLRFTWGEDAYKLVMALYDFEYVDMEDHSNSITVRWDTLLEDDETVYYEVSI